MRTKRAAAAFVAMAGIAAVQLWPMSAGARTGPATERVIVVLRNQVSNLPATRRDMGARRSALASAQAPVVSELSAAGAQNVHRYTLINAVSATVSSAEASALKANPAVSEVVPDRPIRVGPMFTTSPSRAPAAGAGAPGAKVCPAPGRVQLNPEALPQIHAASDEPNAPTAQRLGIDGRGVVVGFIADGLDINNPDFIRPNGQHVFVDYKDFAGGGTGAPTGGAEAFGDASSIAAQGRHVYNVEGYGPNAVTSPCLIRILGVAPGASLVGLDIFNNGGTDYNSTFMQAIDYAVTVDHVNVLNESIGINDYPDDTATRDLVKAANDAAVAAGTTVTVSSGDSGVTNTVGTPASDPSVITAGGTTSYRSFLQFGYGGAQFPGITGYLSNNISSLSSSGFEQDGRTIDVVAPGELNWALCSTNVNIYQDCVNLSGNPSEIQDFGGTSEAAPLTAGVAALVYEAYHTTHGTFPSPAIVKQIITSTAQDIGAPAEQQGSGQIDAYQAVLAAQSYQAPAGTSAPGSTLLKARDQLNAIAPPGTTEQLTTTVTNTGRVSETVGVSTRALGPYTQIATQTVTLSDTTSPHTIDYAGRPSNYEVIHFRVPAGQNRLSASIAFQNASLTILAARVRLTLVDPSGRLAKYSLPQGDGNYGNAQVTNPRAGTWTAYVWSRESPYGGTTGPVRFSAGVARYGSFGTVSPTRLRLGPGQSAPLTLTVSTPSTPGDAAGAIVFRASRGPSFGRLSTVPVTLRSLVPNRPTSFQQTLTGGNGRQTNTGQTFYYQFDVPAGRPELNAAVTLTENPNNPFTLFLVSPSGETLGTGSNELASSAATTPGYTNELGGQVHALNPAPGRWTLIVDYAPQVSGTAISEPFRVSTSETAMAATSTLPNGASNQLAAGQPQTYQVRVTNRSSAPAAYFVDPRLEATTTLNLVSLTSPATIVPLTGSSAVPYYLVPTHSTQLAVSATTTGATPIMFDTMWSAGDPDFGSTTGTSVDGFWRDTPVAPGAWIVYPDVVGPFGTTGAPNETVTTAMSAVSQAFDPAVSSSTGDLWQGSVNPSALSSLSPTVIGPGQTATISVTVTPKGTAGSVQSGTLYVDIENLFQFQVNTNVVSLSTGNPSPGGSEVAAIPYSYTIK